MRRYEFISHTAEAGLLVQSDTMDGLFRAALQGMAEWLKPAQSREAVYRRQLTVTSVSRQTLLVDFLIEVLTRSQIERVVFFDAEFSRMDPSCVEATLVGSPVEQFEDDIKAITYHGAGIRKREDGLFESEVIFDI